MSSASFRPSTATLAEPAPAAAAAPGRMGGDLDVDHPVVQRRLAAKANAAFRHQAGTARVVPIPWSPSSHTLQVTGVRVRNEAIEAQISHQQPSGMNAYAYRWLPVASNGTAYDLFDAQGVRIEASREPNPAVKRDYLVRNLLDAALNHPAYENMGVTLAHQGEDAAINALRSMAREIGMGSPREAVITDVIRELWGHQAIQESVAAGQAYRAWRTAPVAPYREEAPSDADLAGLTQGSTIRVGGGLKETVTNVLVRQPLGALGFLRPKFPLLSSSAPTVTVATAQRTHGNVVLLLAGDNAVTVPPVGVPTTPAAAPPSLGEPAEDLPARLHLVLEHGQQPVVAVIERGAYGFTCSQAMAPAEAMARNRQAGVTQAQAMAMQIGAVLGWAAPGANPRLWETAAVCRDLPPHLLLLVQAGITGPHADIADLTR